MTNTQFYCDYCGQIRLGMKEQVMVPEHCNAKEVGGRIKFKFIDRYYICENCKEYDRQKYLEEVI